MWSQLDHGFYRLVSRRFVGRRNQFNPGIAAWSLDPLVLPRQYPLRNRNADLLRRFEIDDELEFDRLLEGNISSIDAVEIFLYLGKAPVLRSTGSPICCHKSIPPCRLATREKPASRRMTVA